MGKGERKEGQKRVPLAEGLLVVTLATLAVLIGVPTKVPVEHVWPGRVGVLVCDTAPDWVLPEVRRAAQSWRSRGAKFADVTQGACLPCSTEIREAGKYGRSLPGAPCLEGSVVVDVWRWGGEGWNSKIVSGYTVTERALIPDNLPAALWSTALIPNTDDKWLRRWLVTHELGHAAGLGHAVKGWDPDRSPVRAKYHVMSMTYDDFGTPWREGEIKPSAWEGIKLP